jgi:hypothetical protein
MSHARFQHAYVPHGRSRSSTSIDECLRPGLRQAFPLPEDQDDDRFQHLLEALARRDVDREAIPI